VPPREPVLVRADGEHRSLSAAGAALTVLCLVVGGLFVALRNPPAPAERMTVMLPPVAVSPVAQQDPVPAGRPHPTAASLPRIGDWTPQRGVRIAQRAAKWLGWPYSFGAGGVDGPSYGHAVDADSHNDGHVFGFDCSGLTMYALGPWRSLPHDAAAQYHSAGSYHPPLDQLQPGDLVFWSPDGTVNAIGHVAVYVGNGEVVQAPQSGQTIRVSPLYGVERAYMGATRPLS